MPLEIVQEPPEGVLRQDAIFDSDRVFRYAWWRQFYPFAGRCLHVVMLNPSTADAVKSDPTVTRCLRFAASNGFGSLWVSNLFAFRSTDPKCLKTAGDPVGPDNDGWIRRATRFCDQTWVAWGEHGSLYGRDQQVLKILWEELPTIYCIDTNKGGAPKHPLYARHDTRIKVYDRGEPSC